MHIRKGFINLTPRHWSFFANKTRSETRDVTLFFDGTQDDDCSVWRLQSNDMTRIMLSERARMWVEKNFDPDSFIQVEATRLGETDIRIKLTPPE